MNTEELIRFGYFFHAQQADYAAKAIVAMMGPLSPLVMDLVQAIVSNATHEVVEKLSRYFELETQPIEEGIKAQLVIRCENVEAHKDDLDEHMR